MPLEMGSRSPCTSQTSAAWLLRVALDSVSHGNSMRFRHTVPRCHTSCTVLTLLRRPGKPTQHWTNTLVRIFLGYTCGPSKEKPSRHHPRERRKAKVVSTGSSLFKTCSQNHIQMRLAIFIRKQ